MVQSNYARLEKRGNKLTLEQIEKIAEALGASVNELLGIDQTGQERIAELEIQNESLKKKLSEVKAFFNEFESVKKQIALYDELFKEKTQRSRELQEWARETIRSVEAGKPNATEKLVRLIKDLYLSPPIRLTSATIKVS